jgi:hypothetical protein
MLEIQQNSAAVGGDCFVVTLRPQRHSRAAIFTLSALALSGFAAVTAGDAAAYSDRVRRACTGDYNRLCPGYKLHSSQLRACMESNGLMISSSCINALVDSGEIDASRVKKKR